MLRVARLTLFYERSRTQVSDKIFSIVDAIFRVDYEIRRIIR